jgi:lactoylglutathione lyase
VLTLMKGRTADYPATFHIGFIQATEAAVDALHARLTFDGFAPDAPERSHAYTFYVKAPGGFVVEVLC